MGNKERDELIRAGRGLMDRITEVANEASHSTLRVRVDRLLESAAPAIGWSYSMDTFHSYREDVDTGASKDEVWDALFATDHNRFDKCGCPRVPAHGVVCQCGLPGCALGPATLLECLVDAPETDEMENFFGHGGYVYPDTYSDNNMDVIGDHTMWLSPRLGHLRPCFGPPEPERVVGPSPTWRVVTVQWAGNVTIPIDSLVAQQARVMRERLLRSTGVIE